MDAGEFITLAWVRKVQGRVGEVLTELHTDFPERFAERRQLYLWREGQERQLLQLEDFWPHKGGMVLKFAGIDTIEQAETLLNAEIQIPATERAPLEDGAVYISELMGCQVFDRQREVGQIADIQFGTGTAPLLIVRDASQKEFMIPFAESFIEKLDLEAKRLEMRLPEGLLELDAPLSAARQAKPKAKG